MNQCNHQFVVLPREPKKHGIDIVCVYCAQVRRVYRIGKVVVEVKEGTVIHEPR